MKPESSEQVFRAKTESLRIAPYEASQHGEICRLLAASFRGKFGRADVRGTKEDERTARLLAAAWPYRREPNKLQLAAWTEDAPNAEPLGFVQVREERRFASGFLFREYDWLLMRKEIAS